MYEYNDAMPSVIRAVKKGIERKNKERAGNEDLQKCIEDNKVLGNCEILLNLLKYEIDTKICDASYKEYESFFENLKSEYVFIKKEDEDEEEEKEENKETEETGETEETEQEYEDLKTEEDKQKDKPIKQCKLSNAILKKSKNLVHLYCDFVEKATSEYFIKIEMEEQISKANIHIDIMKGIEAMLINTDISMQAKEDFKEIIDGIENCKETKYINYFLQEEYERLVNS